MGLVRRFDVLIVFLIYSLFAWAFLYIFFHFHTSPALIWPPVGIALAAVYFGGYRMALPVVAAQFFITTLFVPAYVVTSLVVAVGYGIQSVVGAYFLHRVGFQPHFDRVRNALIFLVVAILITTIEPTIATIAQVLFSDISVSALYNWGRAWGGGIFSVAVIFPFIATWWPLRRRLTDKPSELVAAFATLLIVDVYLFWTSYPASLGIAVIFILPAVLGWFAFRLEPRVMTLAFVITSVVGIAGSIIAHPFQGPLNTQLLADEVYIGLLAGIYIVLVAIAQERRSTVKELEQALADVSAADRAKSRFIAILAHEIRNPLAPIVSSLEFLKLHSHSEEVADTIRTIESQTSVITHLLDDLLDTARLSQNRLLLRKEVTDMRAAVEASLESVRDRYAKKQHNLIVRHPEEPVIVFADPVRLQQILVNVLNNAARYTDPGGSIQLSYCKEGSNALIRVEDNGIGIEAERIDELFEPFTHAPDRQLRHGTGLGIGLYLTRELVRLHDGSIEARSAGVGSGSVFSIRLPLSNAQMPENDAMPSRRRAAPHRILIVDDNKPAALAMQRLLSILGHTTEAVHSGQEALTSLARFKPAVMLLDIKMADMDGYEVARVLRSRKWDGLIIALTGYGQEMDKKRSADAGIDHHLTKPVSVDDVISLLRDREPRSAALAS